MKLVIFIAAGFVLGLAGGTGFSVATAPKGGAAADSAAAHPAADGAASHPAEGGTEVAQAPTVTEHAPEPVAASTAAPGTAAAAASATGHDPALDTAGATLDASSPESYGQVARILGNMKAADAAKIMAYLGDEQVEGVLRSMGVRQAASLLALLPPERAAALSRRFMAHTGGTE